VEYDGNADGLFSMRRRNKNKEWLVYTRGVLDKLISFIIAGRTTYTAATRHLSADVLSFRLRRQDVVKLGTAAIRTFRIPPETARCPKCGPSPEFVVIDAQSLGCTDPDEVKPDRLTEDCPVLDIPASKLCVVEQPSLRVAINKILRTSSPLTSTQADLVRSWHATSTTAGRLSVEGAAALIFFHFFPLGVEEADDPAAGGDGADAAGKKAAPASSAPAAAKVPKRKKSKLGPTLEEALRDDGDGNAVLGGKGAPFKKPAETWRDRKGLCAPAFASFPRDDDGVWICVRPFLQAFLAETVTGMFLRKDEPAVKLLGDCMRLNSRTGWRPLMRAVDDVGFVTSFLGRFADELDEQRRFRAAVGQLLVRVIEIEKFVDAAFEVEAKSARNKERGWLNMPYCTRWKHAPSPAEYKRWRAEQENVGNMDEDDPLLSFEFFAGLPRVRPGIRDSEAAKRRVGYRGKDRHVADVEGEGDACGKAFSVKTGLTQGVFNVVCPHVVTLGFRCLFQAESVGEALSILLERFPKLPRAVFYDVACKIDKNAMRRVRLIFREQGVRCILDRPHSITHSCSPLYMPDECLGTTAGVATQAAEVSHSISVVNRTSLAYMAPKTYMSHRMVQVAFMNLRKLSRMHSVNGAGENDHVPLAPFFHAKVSHQCERVAVCTCSSAADGGGKQAEEALEQEQAPQAMVGCVRSSPSIPMLVGGDSTGGDPSGGDDAEAEPSDAHDNSGAHQPEDRGAQDDQLDDGGLDELFGVVPVANQPLRGAGMHEVDGHGDARERAAEAPRRSKIEQLLVNHAAWACGRPQSNYTPMDTRPLSSAQGRLLVALSQLQSFVALRPTNRANINLVAADLQRLIGAGWLDDELMNSFVALINHRDRQAADVMEEDARSPTEAPTPRRRRTRMFNTFFFSRLSATVDGYDYKGVSRWGMKLGLQLDAVDNILIPINLMRSHWVLVNVNVKERVLQFYDSLSVKDTSGVVPIVRRWLHDEVRTRLGEDAAAEWAVDTWQVLEDAGLPAQEDSGSCGVFVLAAADCFSLGCPLSFSQREMGLLRGRVALALFFDDLHCPLDLLGDHPFADPVPGVDDVWGDGGNEDASAFLISEE